MNWHHVIENVYPSLDSANLKAFEEEIGVELPEDYQAFMLQFNGGSISFGSGIPLPESRYDAGLHCLWPLSEPSPGLGVIESRAMDLGEDFFNPAVLRIGDDFGTGFFFIGLLAALRGKIFFAFKEDYWSATICPDCAAGLRQPEGYLFVCHHFDDLPRLIFEHCDTD